MRRVEWEMPARPALGGALVADLARTLRVSADELLGLKPISEKQTPKAPRLLKRLQKIADLPAADQRTVLKLLDALHESSQRTSRPRTKARAASSLSGEESPRLDRAPIHISDPSPQTRDSGGTPDRSRRATPGKRPG